MNGYLVDHNLVKVLTKLGFGFLKSVYQKCLMIELRRGGMKAASQQPIVGRYDDEVLVLLNLGETKVEVKRKVKELTGS